MTRTPPEPPSPRRGHDIPGFALAVLIGAVGLGVVGYWLGWL